MLYIPLTVAKNKQNHDSTGSNLKQVVSCPNCHFYFRPPCPKEAKRGANNLSSRDPPDYVQNNRIQLTSSPLARVRLISEEVNNQQEQILIDSLRNKTITKLQKLKRLNDLNQLKKSRHSPKEPKEPFGLKGNQPISPYDSINHKDPKGQLVEEGVENISSDLMKMSRGEMKPSVSRRRGQSQDVKPVISEEKGQEWIEQIQYSYERKVLLQGLIEWIESTVRLQNLPSHLKMLLTSCSLQFSF